MTAQLSAPDTHLYPTRSHPGILSLLPTRPNPNETKLGFSATPTPLRQLHRTGDQPETFAPLPPSPSLLRRSVPVPRHRARSPRLRGPGPAPLRSSPPRSAEGSSNGTAGAPGGPGPVTPHSAIVGGLGEEQGGGGASRIRPLRGRRTAKPRTTRPRGSGRGQAGRRPLRLHTKARGGHGQGTRRQPRGPPGRGEAPTAAGGARASRPPAGLGRAAPPTPSSPGQAAAPPAPWPGPGPAVTCGAGRCGPGSGVRGPAAAAPGSGAGCVDGGGWARAIGSPLRAAEGQAGGAAQPAAGRQAARGRRDRGGQSPDPGWAPAPAAAAAP